MTIKLRIEIPMLNSSLKCVANNLKYFAIKIKTIAGELRAIDILISRNKKVTLLIKKINTSYTNTHIHIFARDNIARIRDIFSRNVSPAGGAL